MLLLIISVQFALGAAEVGRRSVVPCSSSVRTGYRPPVYGLLVLLPGPRDWTVGQREISSSVPGTW